MKLSRKIIAAFGAAAALAMASTFVGCSDDDENEDGVITVTKNGASVNYDNSGATGTADADTEANTNPSVRRFAIADIGSATSLSTHYDSICQIEYNDANGSPMGYIFGLSGEGSDDKPYSFGIVGLRVKNGTPQYYVSVLKGITGSKGSENMIEQANFGVGTNSVGTEAANTFVTSNNYYEFEAQGYTSIPGTASDIYSDGKLSVVVDIRQMTDGSYNVAFYKTVSDAITDRRADRVNNSVTDKDKPFKADGTRVYTNALGTAVATEISNTVMNHISGEDEAVQASLAYYVNVLPTTKVNGTWSVSSEDHAVTAQDEVVEE